MTLNEVLDLMDNGMWVRVRINRINDGMEKDPDNDLVLWSSDWIGGGVDDPLVPTELKRYLDWDAAALSAEVHPAGRQKPTPMIVIHAYPRQEAIDQ